MKRLNAINTWLDKPTDIAPLITFRILFGALMMVGALRFMGKGWVEKLYVEPTFFFKFYGFEWISPLGATGMYTVYCLIAISAACVMLGLFYRTAIIVFFLAFTYTELVDASNYLNHYYLVSLQAFLLIFLPANGAFSLDTLRKPRKYTSSVPSWTIYSLMFLLAIVYTCAGLAKLNPDWMLRAMPLAIWLPEHSDLPLLGSLFKYTETAFLFSWAGAFYDLFIVYFLLNNRTRPFAYLAVLAFHLLTFMLFNIGLFPFIMVFSTLIYFPGEVHRKYLNWISFGYFNAHSKTPATFRLSNSVLVKSIFVVFFVCQILLPFRHLMYDGNLFLTEEGYRFSWRVMLVEKSGQAIFFVKDPATGRQSEINNSHFLTEFQEKQMSVQPDFMRQFAHFLKEHYQERYDIENPEVSVMSHVALNGRVSQQLTVQGLSIPPSSPTSIK